VAAPESQRIDVLLDALNKVYDKGGIFGKAMDKKLWLDIPNAFDEGEYIIYGKVEIPKIDVISNLAEDYPDLDELDEDNLDDWLQSHKKAVAEMIEEMAWTYREYAESRKPRFGRKFNENDEIRDAVNDAYDKYRACETEPKVCQAIKINDDGTEQKIGIWMDRGNSIGGIVKAIKDGRLRKVLKFSESRKPRFVKESYSGRQVKLTADFEVVGDTVEEALEDLHGRLLNADAAITDGNGNPNGEIVEKYEYWDKENEGDTFFNLCKDSNEKGYMIVELENV
jgi:hypothetical protein